MSAVHDNNDIAVFGNGMIFEQIRPLVAASNRNIRVFYDDDPRRGESILNGSPWPLLYCLGYASMEVRARRLLELQKAGNRFTNFVAPNAILSENVTLGTGVIINQGCIIDNFVTLEDGVFINIGAMISHHTSIGRSSFIAPGANITGFVTIEEGCFIGSNATIINDIHIGAGAVIAAGAVVTKDVEPFTMVAGCPAVVKKRLEPFKIEGIRL